MDERDDERERATGGGTPEPSAGSGEPGRVEGDRPPRRPLDEERLAEGGALPRMDALDPGDPGAPAETLGTESGDGAGPGARHEGGAGGSGAVPGAQRRQGEEMRREDDEPAAGGPPEP